MSLVLETGLTPEQRAACAMHDGYPIDIIEKAAEAIRSTPEGVTAWLDKACEGQRQPITVRGLDTNGMSIPQLVSMWFNGNNAQVIAATQALRDRYDIDFSAEHRNEVDEQLKLAGLLIAAEREAA